jgi:hypothetical protein
MRTRTLLLLAVTCGLAILVAGTIQLLRLADQAETSALGKGDTGRAGDAVIVVDDYDEDGTTAIVTVTLSWEGTDEPPGLDGFALVGVSKVATPLADEGDRPCTGLTTAEVQCTLTFSTDGFKGGSRQLLFRRAAEQVRWRLA